MKLLPEEPTQEMLDAAKNCPKIVFINERLATEQIRSGATFTFLSGRPTAMEQAYQAMFAAAPEVKDEPVAYARTFNGEIMVDGLSVFADTADRELQQMNAEFPYDADTRQVIPLYAHQSPRIAELEAEVARLRRGEFICKSCGIRKDSEGFEKVDF